MVRKLSAIMSEPIAQCHRPGVNKSGSCSRVLQMEKELCPRLLGAPGLARSRSNSSRESLLSQENKRLAGRLVTVKPTVPKFSLRTARALDRLRRSQRAKQLEFVRHSIEKEVGRPRVFRPLLI
jgi:hypothetical protein